MNLGPVIGLLGAAVASLSVFKWIIAGFVVIVLAWMLSTSWASKNALDARALKDLVKSASQWNTRSIQDSNPMISLMNSNYAMAYLNVARSLGSDADIERHTGAAVDELIKDLETSQSRSIQRIASSCPVIMPSGLSAVHTGWLSAK